MANYDKTITEPVRIEQLQSELNSDASIVPSCLGITLTNNEDYRFEFATDLTIEEETALDTIIAAHVPEPILIDVATLPFSEMDGRKLSVHPSYKPSLSDGTTYAVWTGSGDEVDGNGDIDPNGTIGGGPLAHLVTEVDTPETFVDVKFNPLHGRVWIHEAYLKFINAGSGDSISSIVRCLDTPTQQSVQLNLNLDGDNWLTPATNMHLGEFNGTHGFADANQVVLVPRTFSHDGDWDYTEETGLAPNYAGTGEYKMTAIERTIHRYVNRLPCYGDTPYFSITSDETTELPTHYYLRIICHNISNTVWHASVIMEIYRQRTYMP